MDWKQNFNMLNNNPRFLSGGISDFSDEFSISPYCDNYMPEYSSSLFLDDMPSYTSGSSVFDSMPSSYTPKGSFDDIFNANMQLAYENRLNKTNNNSTTYENTDSDISTAENTRTRTTGSNKTKKTKHSTQTKNKSTKHVTYNMSHWKSLGYNESKGKALSDYAFSHATGFNGQCGKGVREAINAIYGTTFKQFGKAKDTGDDFLSTIPKCFKKVSNIEGINLATDLPAGAIVIYREGYSNGKGSYCGHIEIMNGEGKGASDGIVNYPQAKVQYLKEIWIPI